MKYDVKICTDTCTLYKYYCLNYNWIEWRKIRGRQNFSGLLLFWCFLRQNILPESMVSERKKLKMRKCLLLGGSDPLAVQRAASRLGNWGGWWMLLGHQGCGWKTPLHFWRKTWKSIGVLLVMRCEILFLEWLGNLTWNRWISIINNGTLSPQLFPIYIDSLLQNPTTLRCVTSQRIFPTFSKVLSKSGSCEHDPLDVGHILERRFFRWWVVDELRLRNDRLVVWGMFILSLCKIS